MMINIIIKLTCLYTAGRWPTQSSENSSTSAGNKVPFRCAVAFHNLVLFPMLQRTVVPNCYTKDPLKDLLRFDLRSWFVVLETLIVSSRLAHPQALTIRTEIA